MKSRFKQGERLGCINRHPISEGLQHRGEYECRFLTLIFKENIEQVFKDRAEKIMMDGDGIGWGFSDELCNLYYSCFDE